MKPPKLSTAVVESRLEDGFLQLREHYDSNGNKLPSDIATNIDAVRAAAIVNGAGEEPHKPMFWHLGEILVQKHTFKDDEAAAQDQVS